MDWEAWHWIRDSQLHEDGHYPQCSSGCAPMPHGLGGAQAGVAPSGASCGSRQIVGVKGCGVTGAAGRDSTIQLVPIQASVMCSGASTATRKPAATARSVQVMLRPWLTS